MSDNVPMAKGTERRDARLTIRIPLSVKAELEREAERERRTVSDMIIIFVTDALAIRTRKGGR